MPHDKEFQVPDPNDGEFDWHLGSWRLKQIASIIGMIREAYINAEMEPNSENLQEYNGLLKALAIEILNFREPDTKYLDRLENLEHEISNANKPIDNQIGKDILEDLREIDIGLNRLRVDCGLSIPKEEQIDPDEAFRQ